MVKLNYERRDHDILNGLVFLNLALPFLEGFTTSPTESIVIRPLIVIWFYSPTAPIIDEICPKMKLVGSQFNQDINY